MEGVIIAVLYNVVLHFLFFFFSKKLFSPVVASGAFSLILMKAYLCFCFA